MVSFSWCAQRHAHQSPIGLKATEERLYRLRASKLMAAPGSHGEVVVPYVRRSVSERATLARP